jgi:hypothetical protein
MADAISSLHFLGRRALNNYRNRLLLNLYFAARRILAWAQRVDAGVDANTFRPRSQRKTEGVKSLFSPLVVLLPPGCAGRSWGIGRFGFTYLSQHAILRVTPFGMPSIRASTINSFADPGNAIMKGTKLANRGRAGLPPPIGFLQIRKKR